MKILQIVTETTQTLDYTIPIIKNLKDIERETNKNFEISILYCTLDKIRFTKNSKYLEDFSRKNSVNSIDLSDFKEFYNSLYVKLFKLIIGPSISSPLSIKDYILKIHLFGKDGLRYLFTSYKKMIEDAIVGKLLIPSKIIEKLSPDIIFFDNRDTFKNIAAVRISQYLSNSDIPIFIIPHAPHGDSPTNQFFSITDSYYPKSIEYWACNNRELASWHCDDDSSSFNFIGLTALDEIWSGYIKERRKLKVIKNKENILYVLYIPQKFHNKSFKPNFNEVDMISYEEELSRIFGILMDLDKHEREYEFVIKPHPKMSINTVTHLLYDLNHSSVVISCEPLYYHLERADFVISEFSSAMLYCACHVPVLKIKGTLEQWAYKEWDVLRLIYEGVGRYYNVENLKGLVDSLSDNDVCGVLVKQNRQHLSSFYGYNATKEATKRIMKHTKK